MNGGWGARKLEPSQLMWISVVNFYSPLTNELPSGQKANFQAQKSVMLPTITVTMTKMIMKEKAEMVEMTISDYSDDGNGINSGDNEGTESDLSEFFRPW